MILETELDSNQPIGLYKTYSFLSLNMIDAILQKDTLEDLKDESLLFNLFG